LSFPVFLFTYCFEGAKHPIIVYKVNPTIDIEVYSMGYGATTKDYTDIRKKGPGGSILVKRIDGSYAGAKTEISRINDTLFKITFTDTSIFKGTKRSYDFNLNDKVVPFP
jgi:hypothetical protein